MPEIRAVVNTSSRYFYVLFYNKKYNSNNLLWFFKSFYV